VSLHARVSSGATGVPPGPALPTTTRLYPPYPNPVVQGTTVHVDLARESDLELDIHDVAGRRVAALARGTFGPGRYGVPWNGRGESGATLGPGLYFVRLSIAGAPVRIARLVLLR
jgi:FlgD Ig-like domain